MTEEIKNDPGQTTKKEKEEEDYSDIDPAWEHEKMLERYRYGSPSYYYYQVLKK
jgi:hypothetical protein